MPRSIKIFLAAIFGVVLVVMYLEYTAPKPLDWTPDYSRNSNLPLGTQVLFEQLNNNKEVKLKLNSRPPIESLGEDSISLNQNFIFINNYLPFSGTELDSLLNWVSSGKQAFVSTYYAQTLFDSLGLKTTNLVLNDRINYKPEYQLYNKNRATSDLSKFNKARNYYHHFKELDTLNTVVLGYMQPENSAELKQVNFVKVNYGQGEFFVHLAPEIFSNYFILDKTNSVYTSKVLNYLDFEKPLVWDAYYKTGRERISSPLYYLLTTPSLKWAYYTLLVCLVLFIIFEGKRKQKPIKVVKPLQNKSYEYVQTISGMYLDKKAHHKMALKMIDLFLAKIRQDFHLQTQDINAQFISQLAHKLDTDEEEATAFMKKIDRIKRKNQLSKSELIELEQEISKLLNHG
ncbi:DUF4350 domain-containing protein [Psychroflexus sp. ALD_RP9]|uniref:DUF4350 domain-containing protein n=1 Tax=Psychroflexus sp. ALD_RP9 TaxID=2777186 RepID=UPI001A8E4C02|nr:DUF4350 domain-containing protein [Psychroflexus sp. ALD_RP9]QSS96742.1 hypothetical protein IMZ30_09855 [Psychroflexus sp. ALD_RP9]